MIPGQEDRRNQATPRRGVGPDPPGKLLFRTRSCLQDEDLWMQHAEHAGRSVTPLCIQRSTTWGSPIRPAGVLRGERTRIRQNTECAQCPGRAFSQPISLDRRSGLYTPTLHGLARQRTVSKQRPDQVYPPLATQPATSVLSIGRDKQRKRLWPDRRFGSDGGSDIISQDTPTPPPSHTRFHRSVPCCAVRRSMKPLGAVREDRSGRSSPTDQPIAVEASGRTEWTEFG